MAKYKNFMITHFGNSNINGEVKYERFVQF
jgi:hypothetical protein